MSDIYFNSIKNSDIKKPRLVTVKTSYLFLSGPITGCSYAHATGWRGEVEEHLPAQVSVISPLRGMDGLEGCESIPLEFEGNIFAQSKGMTRADRFDMQRSDVVLMYLAGATTISRGTLIEAGWADIMDKPLVLVMEKEGNVNDHPMLREIASYHVETLKEGIEVAVRLLSSGV